MLRYANVTQALILTTTHVHTHSNRSSDKASGCCKSHFFNQVHHRRVFKQSSTSVLSLKSVHVSLADVSLRCLAEDFLYQERVNVPFISVSHTVRETVWSTFNEGNFIEVQKFFVVSRVNKYQMLTQFSLVSYILLLWGRDHLQILLILCNLLNFIDEKA